MTILNSLMNTQVQMCEKVDSIRDIGAYVPNITPLIAYLYLFFE